MSSLSVYVVTFNCGRELCDPKRLSAHLFDALVSPQKAPSILVLALQEVAPIAYAFLGGSYLAPYLAPFRHAVSLAAETIDARYENIITRNVGMITLMVFVRQEESVKVREIEDAGVGTGMYEMGNKGAVAVRLGYRAGDSTVQIALVSAHLAPMEDSTTRRNEDWRSIVQGLIFTPATTASSASTSTPRTSADDSSSDTAPLLSSTHDGSAALHHTAGIYSPTAHLLVAGDLNYRTSAAAPLPDEYRIFPQPCGDTSYPQHYWHLFERDQLTQELRAQQTLQGLSEAPVDFPPTYKYSDRARRDVDESKGDMDADGRYWDWAKHRWPSWCDRVLYLDVPSWMKTTNPSAKVVVEGYTALPLMPSSDHRPVACSVSIPLEAIPALPEDVDTAVIPDAVRRKPPFELDAAWETRRSAARRREIVVGLGAYMALTWEGRGILLALLCGALGGWTVIGSMIES